MFFADFDSGRNLVFFHGYRDCAVEKHGYVVALDRPCHVRRLTESNYSHSCDFFVVSMHKNTVLSDRKMNQPCRFIQIFQSAIGLCVAIAQITLASLINVM